MSAHKIQGISGEKINVLGGDGICHREEKISYEHVPNSDWLPR